MDMGRLSDRLDCDDDERAVDNFSIAATAFRLEITLQFGFPEDLPRALQMRS